MLIDADVAGEADCSSVSLGLGVFSLPLYLFILDTVQYNSHVLNINTV